MSVNATAIWRIRVGGDNLNGGGFDPGISGAGTDYTDQDTDQLSLTDFATSGAGVATLTSATGGFTAAMVGNCVRIASGTNFTAGYYFVTAYTDTHTVTLDRSPTPSGAGSGGTGRLGGAWGGTDPFQNVNASTNSPTLPTAVITPPIVPSNIVYVRGSGSNAPSSDDYTLDQTKFGSFQGGDTTGRVKYVGYNGRPRVSCGGLLFYHQPYVSLENFYVKYTSSTAGYQDYGLFGGFTGSAAVNCYVDVSGGATAAGIRAVFIEDCEITDSVGGTYSSTQYGVLPGQYGGHTFRCRIHGLRGHGVFYQSTVHNIAENLIYGNQGHGINLDGAGSAYGVIIRANTINGNSLDGVHFSTVDVTLMITLTENVISNHTGSGKYGTNVTTGNGDRLLIKNDRNVYYNNSTHRNNLSAGPNDQDGVNPQYANPAAGDFTPTNPALALAVTLP